MSKKLSTKILLLPQPAVDAAALLYALPVAVLTVDRRYRIHSLNPAAEDFLGASEASLRGKEFTHHLYPVSRLLALVDGALEKQSVVREYDAELHGPRIGHQRVTLQAAPMLDHPGLAVLTIEKQAAAHPAEAFNPAAAGMAAILAHELKNPLSGIKGAAQLLQKKVAAQDAHLPGLIASEVDRISALINEMEILSDETETASVPVNIHEVLQHVKRVAENGFASRVRFEERYDPSLPSVRAHRGRLIQLFMNLIKNASEAIENTENPEIILSTTYVSGARFRRDGQFHALPIRVTVEDNGPGIPESIRTHLFEPFVTTKQGGRGLGLAVVSKIVALHGAAIDAERTENGLTRFKVLLPAAL